MDSIRNVVYDLLSTAISTAFPDISNPPVIIAVSENGAYQCNSAIQIVNTYKQMGKKASAREIANKIVQEVTPSQLIEKMDVANTGFINISLSKNSMLKKFSTRITNEVQTPYNNKQGVDDFSSPNPPKEMHMEHLRPRMVKWLNQSFYNEAERASNSDLNKTEQSEYKELQENNGSTKVNFESVDKNREQPSKLNILYDTSSDKEQDASRLLRSVFRLSEMDIEDYDCNPNEDNLKKVNKTIMVGNDYQAVIPEGLCNYDDALPYENEDKLLWDPNPLEKHLIEDFLSKAALLAKPPLPMGSQIRDDEQALYLLLQCGHNMEEALRRIRINVIPITETMSLWSEEECRNFESGMRSFGKNFHLIQQNKVRTRSVGELVQFYYLWKKSERHDIFANKTRLEKKKYTLHPGLVDFMDRFLEDQDGKDSSSPSNVQGSNTESKKITFDSIQLNQKTFPEQ